MIPHQAIINQKDDRSTTLERDHSMKLAYTLYNQIIQQSGLPVLGWAPYQQNRTESLKTVTYDSVPRFQRIRFLEKLIQSCFRLCIILPIFKILEKMLDVIGNSSSWIKKTAHVFMYYELLCPHTCKELTLILGLLPRDSIRNSSCDTFFSEISTGVPSIFLRFAKEFLNVFFKNNHSRNYFFRNSSGISLEILLENPPNIFQRNYLEIYSWIS